MEITAHNAAVTADWFGRNPQFRVAQPAAPALPTLADCDARGDMDDLLSEVERACADHCTDIDLADDTDHYGKRCLDFTVRTECYDGSCSRDEDGISYESGPVRLTISIEVRPAMSLGEIARLVANEVKGIDNNCFG